MSTLELLLRACLPQIFTVVVVKAMCVRGARKKNQAMLASYLAHVANLSPSGSVPKNMSLHELMDVAPIWFCRQTGLRKVYTRRS